jgi:hypothetical protein
LRGDHGTLVQFDQSHGIGSVGIVSRGGFINGGVRVHLTLAAKGVEILGFVAAVRADIARGEDLVIAVRADLADQSVALFFESPVSRDFHVD